MGEQLFIAVNNDVNNDAMLVNEIAGKMLEVNNQLCGIKIFLTF